MSKPAAQLDAEIAETIHSQAWQHYLAMVPQLIFNPVDAKTWSTIRDEGLDQEQKAPKRDQWRVAELPISRADANGLQRFNAATVEKFNSFDIALKRTYDGKIVDLVDYEDGLVRLVKATRRATEFHRDRSTRKRIPGTVKAAIEAGATEFIEGSYRRHASIGGKEPCVTVGLVADYLRQAHMPEDFRWATKDQQRSWTRSVLESMRRKGQLGSSFGASARCYEPKK